MFWGANWAAVKIGNREFAPIFMAGLRSLIATICLAVWLKIQGKPLFPNRSITLYGVGAGILFGLEFALIYVGLKYTYASRVYVLLYTAPFFTALGAHFFLKGDRLTHFKVFGLILAFGGIVSLFVQKLGGFSSTAVIGDLMIVGAGALWGSATVYTKKYLAGKAGAVHVLFFNVLFSMPILFWHESPLGNAARGASNLGRADLRRLSKLDRGLSYLSGLDRTHYPLSREPDSRLCLCHSGHGCLHKRRNHLKGTCWPESDNRVGPGQSGPGAGQPPGPIEPRRTGQGIGRINIMAVACAKGPFCGGYILLFCKYFGMLRQMFERVKLGLSLGAGGARGMAHLGVLKAMEQAGIRFHYMAGSSIGSVVGAAYAVSGNAAELESRVLEFIASDLYRNTGLELVKNAFNDKPETWTHRLETWLKKRYLQAKVVARQAVLDSAVYREMIAFFIPDINIEDLPFPMWITGTDLRTGRPVAFRSGSLRDAVYGSSAIPGVVLPLEKNGMLVVDGGVVNMVPSLPARHLGADVVLAVDVDKPVAPEDGVDNAFELLFRVEDIQGFYLKELQLREADMVLRPQVGHIHWSDFGRAAEMIRLGRDAAQEQLDAIIALSRRRKMPWQRRGPVLRDPALDWISI